MSQPYDRSFNFSAGPSCLPLEVLEQVREGLFNYAGTGVSVMEMSHRSKPFEEIIRQAEVDLRELLNVPENYAILFLQGGASLQFSMLAMNFLRGRTASYVTTGEWSSKAIGAAKLEGNAVEVWTDKANGFRAYPDQVALAAECAYVHFTSNETIQGVQFLHDPSFCTNQICDMSSDILSRPIDVSRYKLIYAGAQKNMGPAGLTVVVIEREFALRGVTGLPPMLDYRTYIENQSMYNTPSCWSIYVAGLVFQHWRKQGGLTAVASQNEAKAQVLYSAIDGSNGFYVGHASPEARSRMNVTFTLRQSELTDAFLAGAAELRMSELKGHRSVGGLRASIYNAFPLAGCQALAEYMNDFALRHA